MYVPTKYDYLLKKYSKEEEKFYKEEGSLQLDDDFSALSSCSEDQVILNNYEIILKEITRAKAYKTIINKEHLKESIKANDPYFQADSNDYNGGNEEENNNQLEHYVSVSLYELDYCLETCKTIANLLNSVLEGNGLQYLDYDDFNKLLNQHLKNGINNRINEILNFATNKDNTQVLNDLGIKPNQEDLANIASLKDTPISNHLPINNLALLNMIIKDIGIGLDLKLRVAFNYYLHTISTQEQGKKLIQAIKEGGFEVLPIEKLFLIETKPQTKEDAAYNPDSWKIATLNPYNINSTFIQNQLFSNLDKLLYLANEKTLKIKQNEKENTTTATPSQAPKTQANKKS